MHNAVLIFESSLLIFLFLSVSYLWVLAIVYFFRKDMAGSCGDPRKIVILVPAHNEELIILGLCKNILNIQYNESMYDIYVVADNCDDNTASICADNNLKVIARHDDAHQGKGYAIKYAIEKIPIEDYDALLIIDADTYVDPNILNEISKLLSKGEVAIQCYIKIPNRSEGWFTELQYVSRVINGLFYHFPKYSLGLSSYLMGSGICFSTKLLKKKGWTAFSIAEDWEYYAQLLLDGYRIAFAKNAIVYQHESRSLAQATSQRLRWSSGRWKVTKTLGLQLLFEGLKKRSLLLSDASLPLIFPNCSLQFNLTLVALSLALLLPSYAYKDFYVIASLGLLAAQFLLFLAGAFVAGSPLKTLYSALYAPLFLVWKSVIDILCFTGLYRTKKWVRTKRHQSADSADYQ